ncbi:MULTISPECIES: hypothetical protein [unclassified Streptomyces]|uniref:hypothetical protein n=1 Tax=unclassified Streptomyces TaxID=2593676 RepID=UPI00336A73CB
MPHAKEQPSRLDGAELDELGNFFTLYAERQARGDDRVMPMFSARIDAAWHQLNTDPAALAAFCDRHAGLPVGHAPLKGSGRVGWVEEYAARFGTLPAVWFTDVSGQVDTDLLGRYERTGIVITDWDCSPVPGDGGDVAKPPRPATARRR